MPKSKVREEPTVRRKPEVFPSHYFTQLTPPDPRRESQKHPRVQIGIYIMSLKPCRVTFLTRW